MLPRLEPTILTIVAVCSEEQLGLNKYDAAVDHEHAAVVANIAMHHRHTNVAEDIWAFRRRNKSENEVPRVTSDLRICAITSQAWRNVSDSRK